jgi:maltooligosyltrehalose trehalohydrolase
MLFQGQEFLASTPFVFFADHHPELAKQVITGRRKFLEQFPSIARLEAGPYMPNPECEESFMRCKLDLSERERNSAAYLMHRDLLKLRREDAVFRDPLPGGVDGALLGAEAFLLRFFGGESNDSLLLINLGTDLQLGVMPEPLLAPVEGCKWELLWSSEDPRYGGSGTPTIGEKDWRIPGHAALVLRVGKS